MRTWPQLAQLCTTLPIAELLDACSEALADTDECDVWLWDHQRVVLTSIATERSITAENIEPAEALGTDIYLPLVYQGDDLGAFTARCATEPHPELEDIVALLAIAIRAGESTTDTINVRRRRRAMSLPAEMQWALLPPTQFSLPGAELSAAVEPAYDTGGDVFDYALTGTKLSLAVLDARGHGLRSATTATVATNAMRRARRSGASLLEIADEVSNSITTLGDDGNFVSGVMLEIDTTTWEGTWISAGHHPPLLVDDRIAQFDLRPALPFGLVIGGSTSQPFEQSFSIDPGQALTLYSDGIVENVTLDVGDVVGDERFHDVLKRRIEPAVGAPQQRRHVARSVVDDLLGLTGTVLRDDATIMVLQRPRTSGTD